MIKLYKTLLLSTLISTAIINTAYADDNTTWPMYQGNPAHTGYVPLTLNPAKFSKAWEVTFGDDPSTTTIVNATSDGSKLFIITKSLTDNDTNKLIAIDNATGNTLWTTSLSSGTNIFGPTLDDNDDVITMVEPFQQDSTSYGMYSSTNGSLLRSIQSSDYISNDIYSPDFTIFDNQNYYCSCDISNNCGIDSDDLNTYQSNWIAASSQSFTTSPAVDNNFVINYYFGDQRQGSIANLVILDRNSGKMLATIKDPNKMEAGEITTPIIDETNHLVYVIGNGHLSTFDLKTFKLKYSIQNIMFDGQPSLVDSTLYAQSSAQHSAGNQLRAIDVKTGKIIWSWAPRLGTAGNPIITTNNLLFISLLSFDSSQLSTTALSLKTHKPVWTYPIGGKMLIAGNKLYIINQNTVDAVNIE